MLAIPNSDSNDELFRLVHSLKGTAGSYNFHVISKICHHLEDIMMSLMQRHEFYNSSTVSILLKYIDLLSTTTSLIQSKSSFDDVDGMLNALSEENTDKMLNILIVEPSKAYASLIEHILAALPVKINYVPDGILALENLLNYPYDLLITSMESPRLNGDALVAALRLGQLNKDIKVVLITSRAKDKIANNDDFDLTLEREGIKDGSLKTVVEKML